MLLGYSILRIQNPQVDMSLHLMEQSCDGIPPNKHALQDP